jgi:hypothetical protein
MDRESAYSSKLHWFGCRAEACKLSLDCSVSAASFREVARLPCTPICDLDTVPVAIRSLGLAQRPGVPTDFCIWPSRLDVTIMEPYAVYRRGALFFPL